VTVRRAVGPIVALVICAWLSGEARAAGDADDPAEVYRVRFAIDVPIIAVTSVASLIPYAFASRIIHPSCPCSPASVNSFDRGVIGNASDTADVISTATVGLAIVVPPIADWIALRRVRPWLGDVVVFAEALSVNGALVTAAKYTVQRPIPRVYSDPSLASEPRNYRSFYSGHTSLAFSALSAASVTLNARYGLTWQPWAVTLLVGASVAAERVLAGYHFYTDVLVGAGAGVAVGTTVSVLHLRPGGLRLSVLRPVEGRGAGLAIGGPL
jgi:membrane-associated phospholipid phosphatase